MHAKRHDGSTSGNKIANLPVRVVLVAALVQVAFVLLLPESYKVSEASDYFTFYRPLAQNIRDGKGLVTNGRLPSRYPPGFPGYLAAVFLFADRAGISRDDFVMVSNIFISILSCLFLYKIGAAIFEERIGVCAALLWASYPFNLWLLKQANSEVPFILVLFAAVWLVVGDSQKSLRRCAVSGLLAGIGALIRPIAVLIPFVIGIYLLFRPSLPFRRRLLSAALNISAFLLAILPWEVALHVYSGHWILLSTGGPPSMINGLTYPVKYHGMSHEWIPRGAADLIARVEQQRPVLNSAGDVVSFLISETVSHPVGVLEIGLLKLVRSWYATESMSHEGPIALVQAVYLLLSVPGIYFAWRKYPAGRSGTGLLLGLILYFWAMTVMVLSILRYMVPVMGFVLIFGALTINCALVRARIWRRAREEP